MKKIFESYIDKLKTEKDKNGKLKNYWATVKEEKFWADCWKAVEQSGLKFDGKHITITQNGLTFDYVAYKNKMLLVYPKSKIDVELVYKGDEFSFKKENGVIEYSHTVANPFSHKDEDIIGGYCVIKNKRGEFLTTLSKDEITKAKLVAKTDTIWKAWYSEMCKKTVIKKAIKFHFDDIYTEMEEEDNKNYDLDKPVESAVPVEDKNLTLFKEIVKDFEDKQEWIDKFFDADIEERRAIYKNALIRKKGVKNDNP